MILVDTSIWIDHLHTSDSFLQTLLEREQVLIHPFVLGEIALGHVRRRQDVLRQLGKLRLCSVARDEDAMRFIAERRLSGRGIGYVDVHLLVSTLLTPEARLWTHDKRLAAVAQSLQIGFQTRVN